MRISSDLEKFGEHERGTVPIAAKPGGVPIARDTNPLPVERDHEPALGVVLRARSVPPPPR